MRRTASPDTHAPSRLYAGGTPSAGYAATRLRPVMRAHAFGRLYAGGTPSVG